jgi:hypothetical protein
MITVPVSLSEGHMLQVVEKRLRRRILGLKRNEAAAC